MFFQVFVTYEDEKVQSDIIMSANNVAEAKEYAEYRFQDIKHKRLEVKRVSREFAKSPDRWNWVDWT